MIDIKESGEMYLETIIILSQTKEHVRSIDIADYMNFSKPSVSRAVSILKDENYIDIDNNGYITLTEKGHNIAASIYERHLFLTDFFTEIGINPEVAEADACKIEHDISEETFIKLKELYAKLTD